MKKAMLTAVLTSALLIMNTAGFTAAHADEETKVFGDLEYRIYDNEAWIVGCSSSAVEVDIPSQIDGYPVTYINSNTFIDCTDITSVNIPDSVKLISDYSLIFDKNRLSEILAPLDLEEERYALDSFNLFNGNKMLTSIKVSENNPVYSDVDGILYNKDKSILLLCPQGIRGDISIPDGVAVIIYDAFLDCTELTNITLPDSVRSIGNTAYCNCHSLTSINIPDNVETIGNGAFANCYSLTGITIPEKVSELGQQVFYDCKSLSAINVSPNNPAIYDIDGIVYNKKSNNLIYCPQGYTGDLAISYGATYIDSGMFSNCTGLTGISIPDSVKGIGSSVFSNCTSLSNITIPKSVLNIDREAFSNCTNLTNVTLSDSIRKIDSRLFFNCTSLDTITIPDNVSEIGSMAFSGCKNLGYITIPNTVTHINENAFYDCNSLQAVNYTGTESEWKKIIISSGNECLKWANIIYTGKDIHVYVNGTDVQFDQAPVIEEGRTLVPLRAIFEALGADVSWNGDTRTVTAQRQSTVIELTIDSNIMSVNGSSIALDVPACIKNDRTMVPLRAVAEAFGCTVDWNGDTRTVDIRE